MLKKTIFFALAIVASQAAADQFSTAPQVTSTLYASNYGVICDGVTDTTLAMQTAINAGFGHQLILPTGTCVITSTITIGDVTNAFKGITLLGAGNGIPGVNQAATVLQWQGSSTTTPMIRIVGVYRSFFGSFTILSSSSFPLQTAIQSEPGPYGQTGTNTFFHITMSGTNQNGLQYGYRFVLGVVGAHATNAATSSGAVLHFSSVPAYVQVNEQVTDTTHSVIPAGTTVQSINSGAGCSSNCIVLSASVTGGGVLNGDSIQFAGLDAGNDTSLFDGDQVYIATTAAWSFEHSESKAHQMIGCSFSGLGPTLSAYGIYSNGGSFQWHAGIGGGNVGTDFYIVTINDSLYIDGFNSENSGALLYITPETYVPWAVTIVGSRWGSPNIVSGGVIIQSTEIQGPLILIGNYFNGSNSNGDPMKIELINDNTAHVQKGVAIGNVIGQPVSVVADPFICSNSAYCTWYKVGNLFGPNGYGYALQDSTGAIYEAEPPNPTGNSSTTAKMAGLSAGLSPLPVIPQRSGVFEFKVEGVMVNSVPTDGCAVQISEGTGTPPANGATPTGTQLGRSLSVAATGANAIPFSLHAIASGANTLTVTNTYWFDVTQAAVTGGTCTISGLNISAREL